jgi:hypothetical protein
MNKYLRITEFVWLAMAGIAAITTIYMFIIGAKENGIFCLMITLFCAVMWNMRRMFNRRIRRDAEKREAEARKK